MRDEFPKATIEILAKRVGQRCSNPSCGKVTSGPHTEPSKSVSIGVAAHITAASSGGPRYDPDVASTDRRSIGNAIWLCQTCSKLVDSDQAKFTVELLKRWKERAEAVASQEIESQTSKFADREFGPSEEHLIRFATDDWTVWREQGNELGANVIFVSKWRSGDIRYSAIIRLKNLARKFHSNF